MGSQKCWENSGIVGSRAQPAMGTCPDAKQKVGFLFATEEVPARNQQCLLLGRCSSHRAEPVRGAEPGRVGADGACGSQGNTSSQELPSGSQPLLDVREKPGDVTQEGGDGWLRVTSLDSVWVEGSAGLIPAGTVQVFPSFISLP